MWRARLVLTLPEVLIGGLRQDRVEQELLRQRLPPRERPRCKHVHGSTGHSPISDYDFYFLTKMLCFLLRQIAWLGVLGLLGLRLPEITEKSLVQKGVYF